VLVEPESERLPNSAVLFADISGFTTLAERLAKKGEAEGAEILCKHLNAYFGKLVEIIHKNGGDVIKYAGDALLALWYNGPAWLTAMCATQCGLDMQTHTAKYSADSVTLTLHIGVASGAVTGLHLGGVRMRWEYLIGGQPMLEIAHAEAAAKSGDVVLTGRTWGLVSEHCKGRMINGEPALWLLEEISIKFKPPANPPVDPDLSIQASLRSYIPETIRKRIDIGLSDWMAELRRVTVMFVQLTNLTFTGRDEETDKLQHSFTHMQSAIYDYSGIIRQFIIDDKGSVLVAAFFQHEDDPVRALKAGINIISRLKNINVNSSIGVTTGKVFLGAVGSSIRHEFAMVGDTVNLAARLMVVANKFVICDNYTFQAANAYPGTLLKFLSLNSIRVKGKSTLIPIFKASLEASGDVLVCPSLGDNREEAAIVGREEECDLLLKFIEDGLSGKKIVFVEGEEGIGKSLFLSHVRERIANQGCTIANIKGDSANSMTPLHAWRRFTLERIFKFAKPVAENSTEELRAAVLESLSKINSVDAAPLLNDVFFSTRLIFYTPSNPPFLFVAVFHAELSRHAAGLRA
jgi:class 3 adenylate cyclase